MKTLVILRHSKTEKTNPAGDRARELTKPGRRWATEAGRSIVEATGLPDLLVMSDAIRAVQTADLAAEAMNYAREQQVIPEVYGATENELEQIIRQFPDTSGMIVLVGHNPGLEELVNAFREHTSEHLPPAGWVVVQLPIDHWANATLGKGKIVTSGTPKTE